MFRSIVVRCGLVITVALLSVSHAADAAFIPIYGGPTFTPGSGGYRFPLVPFTAGASSAADGVGVGFAEKSGASGAGLGGHAVRWTPTGFTELAPLGVSSQGTPYSYPRG